MDRNRHSLRSAAFVHQRSPGSRSRLRSSCRFATAAIICLLTLGLQGCTQTEVRGSYEVEIEIDRVAEPIQGTLILSTGILDVPSLSDENRKVAGDWFESDTLDMNSCFILHTGSGDDRTPQNVRVFNARIRASEVDLPIEIYRTPLQRIEIVSLQFFANTLGGDVILHDRGQQRGGRIHGVRVGPPTPQRCLDDLEKFRADLASALSR